MDQRLPTARSHATLFLCTLLHGFTHAYGTMFVPLYPRMVKNLHLSGIGAAAFLVTLYGTVYNLGSFAAGILSDRMNRKRLLVLGLLGNAAAVVAIGLCRNYLGILGLGILGGIFGSIFHPAANALAPSHYPKSPGMAIGLLGIGSGLGFFFGPQIAGWRLQTALWQYGSVADWQKPCIEMGLAGLVMGLLFLIVGSDPNHGPVPRVKIRQPMPPRLWKRIALVAVALSPRDFAGVATASLGGIFVANTRGMNPQQAGLFVGIMMLPCVLFSPMAVFLTGRRRRLAGLAVILVAAGILAASCPFWPVIIGLVVLCLYQTLQLASYAVSDAGMLERIHPDMRGRTVGMFLMIAGTVGSLGPWVMGWWTDQLGARKMQPHAYAGPFALCGICLALGALGAPLIRRLGHVSKTAPISLAQEISPATMG